MALGHPLELGQDGGMREHAMALADAIDVALPGWVQGCVARRLHDRPGAAASAPDRISAASRVAGEQARRDIGPRVRALLEADIDEQRTTPLALLREAVRYPTSVLRSAGVPPVERDDAQVRLFPDDVYDLNPATFADVDPSLADLGLAWGAAKAWAHRRRHQAAS
jgi:hypothetical protein